jgi:hypothetical protein
MLTHTLILILDWHLNMAVKGNMPVVCVRVYAKLGRVNGKHGKN